METISLDRDAEVMRPAGCGLGGHGDGPLCQGIFYGGARLVSDFLGEVV